MTRQDEYRAYLRSQEWQWLRELAMERAKGVCELCQKETATAVHHVKYPKQFKDDHPDNLLALCDVCHEKQHGIRAKNMNQQLVSNAEKVSFVFHGRSGTEYSFEFLLVDGKPWIPIREVERKLYQENFKNGSERLGERTGTENFTPLGNMLAIKAATLLKQEWRREAADETWVRATGAFQLLMQSKSQAGEDFRDQLGEWLESNVIQGHAKLKTEAVNQALYDSSGINAEGMALLDHFHQAQGMMIARMKQHQQEIQEARTTALAAEGLATDAINLAAEAKDIALANQNLMHDMHEIGWMVTDQYIQEVAPNLIGDKISQKFGFFISKKIKDSGGRKTDNGWYWSDQQLSKFVPWPGKVAQKMNKWHKKTVLDKLWPEFHAIIKAEIAGLDWGGFLERSGLSGDALLLAKACLFVGYESGNVRLALEHEKKHLRSMFAESVLHAAICHYLKKQIRLEIQVPIPAVAKQCA